MNQSKRNIFSRLFKLLSISGVKAWDYIVMGSLSFISAGMDGVVAALMVPLAKGVLESDFKFLHHTPIFEKLIPYLPGVWQNQNAYLFTILVVAFLGAICLKNVLNYFAVLFSVKVSAFAVQRFQAFLYRRYLSFGKLYYDQVSTSYLQHVMTSDVNRTVGGVQSLERGLSQSFQCLIFLGILFFISWQLTIVLFICLPLFQYSVAWLLKKIRNTANYQETVRIEHSRMLFNALACIPLVKAYSNEGAETRRFSEHGQTIAKLSVSINKKGNLVGPIQEIVIVVIGIFLLGIMSLLYFQFQIGSVAHYGVFIYILRRFNGLIVALGGFRTNIIQIEPSIEHLEQMLQDEDKHVVPQGGVELQAFQDKITFKKLHFQYLKHKPILCNLDLEIPKGKMTAIVGKSGAGKTSLIHILMRFYDCPAGQIFIDGVDIREFKISSLHERTALVSQETYLLNDTLKNNFLYGVRKHVPDDVLNEAIKKASLEVFIQGLPQGLETLVGDRGIRLSGGEKQRVSIARAFLKNPDILLLDEATSSLDSVTEKHIQSALQVLIQGKTSIVVAHRLSTIKSADQIIVLENGALIEKGCLPELLEKRGRFYEFWQEQKFD